MRLLLPRLKDLLFTALSPLPSGVKMVDARPDAWIQANFGALKYPSIFIWGDSDELSESVLSNEAVRTMRVAITCLHHSSSPQYVSFDEGKGVFGLTDKILNVIAKNKTMTDETGMNPVANGARLPINIQSVQRELGMAFVVGTVSIVEFYRDGQVWSSSDNSDNIFIPV